MKVYIPTMEELEKLQSLGVNVYNYIVTKVAETIIMEDRIYDEGNMIEILGYLGDHPEIIYAICKMYPELLSQSIITSKDVNLCRKLIGSISKEDKTIYKLDDILMNMDESILFDEGIIKTTVGFLASNLPSCPKYRFDYLGPNDLLDSIFSCELPISKVSTDSYVDLTLIDPIYSVKLELSSKDKKVQDVYFPVQRGMSVYTGRYGINEYVGSEYQNKDIINKPDENVKKLIKCLDYHKQNYQ